MLVHRLYAAVDIECQIYRAKTTIHEYRDPLSANNPHSYEVTEIELIESSSTPSSKDDSKLVNVSNNSITAAKVIKDFQNPSVGGAYLIENRKKLADKNGNLTA